MPLILGGKPVLLNKRDMLEADLNRLPRDEQDDVYARMVPASGREGREMLMTGVDVRKLAGRRLIVSGSDDRLVPASVHGEMAAKLRTEHRVCAGHAHYLMREPGWEQIADQCVEWIARS